MEVHLALKRRYIKLRLLEQALIQHNWYPHWKRKLGHRHMQRRQLEDTERRQPSVNQAVGTEKEPTLLTASSQIFLTVRQALSDIQATQPYWKSSPTG